MNDMSFSPSPDSADLVGRIEAEHAAVGLALQCALATPSRAGSY